MYFYSILCDQEKSFYQIQFISMTMYAQLLGDPDMTGFVTSVDFIPLSSVIIKE